MTPPPQAGPLQLIDTSAQARTSTPQIERIIAELIAQGVAARCVMTDLEAGYSGRNRGEVEAVAELRKADYVLLPINEAIADRAREVQRRMAARGHHRAAGVIDLLTAAVAEYYGAVILHYDADFEHIAEATGQPHRWIVPRGSVN